MQLQKEPSIFHFKAPNLTDSENSLVPAAAAFEHEKDMLFLQMLFSSWIDFQINLKELVQKAFRKSNIFYLAW